MQKFTFNTVVYTFVEKSKNGKGIWSTNPAGIRTYFSYDFMAAHKGEFVRVAA